MFLAADTDGASETLGDRRAPSRLRPELHQEEPGGPRLAVGNAEKLKGLWVVDEDLRNIRSDGHRVKQRGQSLRISFERVNMPCGDRQPERN